MPDLPPEPLADVLARAAFVRDARPFSPEEAIEDWRSAPAEVHRRYQRFGQDMAESALAARWQPPPRQIETGEQLAALPVGTLVVDLWGSTWHRCGPRNWGRLNKTRVDAPDRIVLTATVLWEPTLGPPASCDDETVSDRGFTHWDPIIPIAGAGDGSDIVQFYESSAATALRGTLAEPEEIDGPFAWLGIAEALAHLTYTEVQRLAGYMTRWLDRHRQEANHG